MTDKTIARNDRGEPIKMDGWFSWRHKDRAAHDAARESYGGRRVERQERKRREAEERNAKADARRYACGHRHGRGRECQAAAR